jgi:electron transfer flavoprotein beta subunit
MKIVACLKRVPTTDLVPKVAGDGKAIDASGVQYMTSFYDEIAVEEALRTKEKLGGEVVALTLGPSDASKEVRECLAKGADRGIVLVDPTWSDRDPFSTALALKQEIEALGAEVVFCGRIATDRDNASVGAMLATLLGWACVQDVVALELAAGGGTAKREADDGIETYSFSLPAVITCQKALNEPRYAGLKGIMAAKKKPVEERPCPNPGNQVEILSLAPPPARKAGRIVGEGAAAVPALIDALRSEAKVI